MVDTNPKQEIEFVAFVGIDWADQKHAWAIQIPRASGRRARGSGPHTGSGRGLGG